MGAHDGIAEPDAQTVTRAVCEELRKQGGLGRATYVVGIQRRGNEGILSLTEIDLYGRLVDRRAIEVPNIGATQLATPGLVRSLLTRSTLQYPAPPGAKAEPTHKRWYGWQTLLTDSAALALLFPASKASSDLLLSLSAGTYAFGGPVVHLAHGNPGRAALSLLGRAGLPVTGALVGMAIEPCHNGDEFCGVVGLVIGGMVGFAAAVVVDAAALAWDEVPDKPSSNQARFRINVAPAVGRNSGGLAVGGMF